MNAVARHASWVLVPDGQLGAFEKRLKALNAKAERAGVGQIVAGEPEPVLYQIHRETWWNDEGQTAELSRIPAGAVLDPEAELVRMLRIPLDYPIIRMGDWRVVAQIEAAGAGENLVFSVSTDPADVAAGEAHRHQAVQCEHCGTHRNRRVSYLLANDAGEFKEVGQQCLEAFTGIDPSAALFLAKMQSFTVWEDQEPGVAAPNAIGTREFLVRVAFLVQNGGFVSATRAREEPGRQPTYQLAANLDGVLQHDAELREAWRACDRDKLGALVEALRTWYALNASSTGFDANVRTLLADDSIRLDPKHLAFAAAAVPTYLRQQQRQREQAIDPRTLGHVGEAGKASTMELRVSRVISFETMYGPATRVLLADRQGNRLTWKTSSPLPQDLREAPADAWFVCQFKVKEHGTYQDVPQTVVTHFKVMGPVLTDEPDETEQEALRPC